MSCILSEPIIFLKSYFGESKYPFVYNNMDCEGWEDGLCECKKTKYLSLECSRGMTAVFYVEILKHSFAIIFFCSCH